MIGSSLVKAQSVIPANDHTGTFVTPVTVPGSSPIQINITGGKVSGDGANLFHSFQQFNVPQNQIINFISTPNIQNILGRINGGSPSFIDGLIQVTGGNSNLFLMNPAGMIFGSHARLDVPASFLATTADGIGFNSSWFNAVGDADWSQLVGNPNAFIFNASQPGILINLAELKVGTEQQLTLLAGTIINQGSLQGGTILVQTVPGENLVRMSQAGYLLSLEIIPSSQNKNSVIPSLSLPQLLTGSGLKEATNITINQAGEIVLSQGKPVQSGDIVLLNTVVIANNALFNANQNLTLIESQLFTTENLNLLAGNTVTIRDGQTPFQAFSGGNITIQGNQNIDILALNFSQIPLQAGGDLTLISDGLISGDAHFAAGGNFQILNLSGTGGTFFSFYDPIIYADGNVIFGDYSGASLKIEAQGSIQGGDINITQADTEVNTSDIDAEILRSSPSLILRSGQILTNPPTFQENTTINDTFFINSTQNLGNNISVGNITTAGGPVILQSPGEIVVDSIATSGGNLELQGIGNITISGTLVSDGGNISIATENLFRVQGNFTDSTGINVSISSAGGSGDGNILIQHRGGVETPFIIGDASKNGTAGAIKTGSEILQSGFIVPVPPANFTQGNITISTNYTAPPEPTSEPTPEPTAEPTPQPTAEPTPIPTNIPTPIPTNIPTPIPTNIPTPIPTNIPTPIPTNIPTPIPTNIPTPIPTNIPTPIPTNIPTPIPTNIPTPIPTNIPTPIPRGIIQGVREQSEILLQATPTVLIESDLDVQNIGVTENEQVLNIDSSIDVRIQNQLPENKDQLTVRTNENNQVTIEQVTVNNPSIIE
ncbi:MAG: filamentous hemagglutinin N-terminal domain-containing protein, partial [Planktothrix sp.]